MRTAEHSGSPGAGSANTGPAEAGPGSASSVAASPAPADGAGPGPSSGRPRGTLPVERARRRRRRALLEAASGIGYLSPALVILGVFLFYPLIKTGYLSAFITDVRGRAVRLAGWENYLDVLTSSTFLPSLRLTFLFALMTVPSTIVIALLLAVMTNRRLRGITLFRTTYASTMAVSAAAAAVMFRALFHPSAGAFNTILGMLGLPEVGWLTDPSVALISVALTTVWMSLGFNFLVLLGGLQSIPDELYEAAMIDGAGSWRRLVHVTVPLLSPVLLFVGIVLVIDSFQSFGQIDILTQGGPAGSTNLIVYEIYQNAFTRNEVGFASAQAVVLFLIVLVLTALQFKISERKVHYQ
jgi:ABC-type sugar transport system permease subunit